MEALPEELWCAIVAVSPIPVLKSLRLVSHRIHERATPELFHTIYLCPYRDSFERMVKISFQRSIRAFVKRIIYDAAMLPGLVMDCGFATVIQSSGSTGISNTQESLRVQYLEEQASLISRRSTRCSVAQHYLADAMTRLRSYRDISIIYDGTRGQHAEVFRATGVVASPEIGLQFASSHLQTMAHAERAFLTRVLGGRNIRKITLPLIDWNKIEANSSDADYTRQAYIDIERLITGADVLQIARFQYDDKVSELLTVRSAAVPLIPFLLLSLWKTTHLILHLRSTVQARAGSDAKELYPMSLMVNRLEVPPNSRYALSEPFWWSLRFNNMKHAELSGLQGSWEELISLIELWDKLEYLAISTILNETVPAADFAPSELFWLEQIRRKVPQTPLKRLILNQAEEPAHNREETD